MSQAKEYTISSKDGEKTSFHIVGNDIIPYSNFILAQKWYAAEMLTPESKKLMDQLNAKHK